MAINMGRAGRTATTEATPAQAVALCWAARDGVVAWGGYYGPKKATIRACVQRGWLTPIDTYRHRITDAGRAALEPVANKVDIQGTTLAEILTRGNR